MNLPPPPPMTANALLENTTQTFMETEGIGEDQARRRAARALVRLISIGALEWWGMTDQGEPLFVEAAVQERQHVIYILPIPIREEET